MRTRWFPRLVTFLVAILMFSACGDNKQITKVIVNIWLPLGTRTDTTGTCVRTTMIGTSDTSNVAGSNILLPRGEADSLSVSQRFNPSGCGTPYTFRWSTSNASVVSVTAFDSVSARITAISSGTAVITATAVEDSTIVLRVTVVVPGVSTPTPVSISVEPVSATLYSGQTMTLGTGTYRVVVTMSDGTTRVNDLSTFSCSSANTSQVTVNSSCLISALAPTTSGGVVVTYAALGVTGVTDTLVVSVNALPVISLNPVSLCFSTVVGTPQSQTVTVTVTGASVSNVVLASNTTGVTVSGSGSTWTVTRTAGSVVANGSLVATLTTMSGVVTAIPVQIISTVCPGTTSSIDFTPSGGPLPIGLDTLTATCVQGAEIPNVCEPYWTSSDPSIATVRGNTAKPVGPMTFWVGLIAYLERLRPGTVEICVQWSLTQTSPRRCYTFTSP
ncbi:MAG TPA: hypothetical protein PLD99_01535 [Parcubacteria group bacterium]|nr:hypothetical protein [Parcubacteria group bacterium]